MQDEIEMKMRSNVECEYPRVDVEVKLPLEYMKAVRESSLEISRSAIMWCSVRYGFDGEEACRSLNLFNISVLEKPLKVLKVSKEKKSKGKEEKSLYVLPYDGRKRDEWCWGLKQNHGLYTQCKSEKKGEGVYCKGCESQASKNDSGKPDYGTIDDRMLVDVYEYHDPSGKKPVAYKKVMKKNKWSEELIRGEAERVGMNLDLLKVHFEYADEVKRGRPKGEEKVKVSSSKKGRPKKAKKVIESASSEGEEEEEELFAKLVAENAEEEEVVDVEEVAEEVVEVVMEITKEPETKKKESDKASKDAAKAEKEASKQAEKEKKEEEEAKKEAEKKKKEEEKAAEKSKKEAEKASKSSSKDKKKDKEEAPRARTATEPTVETKVREQTGMSSEDSKKKEEEPDRVKKIEYEGKKYLKSKNTGIIYNLDQDVIGKWNEKTNKIDFNKVREEEEEEDYDESDEE